MKNFIALGLVLVCVFGIIGCSNTPKDLHKSFPEYYNLGTAKGIEVYAWQTNDGIYKCGAMSGTNRNKGPQEIFELTRNGATFEEMRTILSSYNIEKESISIIPIKVNAENFEIVNEDINRINEMFWAD